MSFLKFHWESEPDPLLHPTSEKFLNPEWEDLETENPTEEKADPEAKPYSAEA